jgi:hypothetical protein
MVDDDRDIVLFLGAGFSHAAGLPIMSRFGSHSSEHFATLVRRHALVKTPRANGWREHARTVTESGSLFEGLRQIVRRASESTCIDSGNLEEVFCVAEMLDQAGVHDVPLDNQPYPATALLQAAKQWIWDIYKKYPPRDPDYKSDDRPYKQLIDSMKSAGLLGRLNVLTTNYDLVFEIACHEQNVTCAYPLEGLKKPINTITLDGKLPPYVALDCTNDRPVVCKLHGSVNYLADKDHGLYVANRWKSKGNDQPEVLNLDESYRLLQQKQLTPEIVPPTYAKLEQKPWLQQTWRYAFNALRTAKAVIFIGYSFPESDGFMGAMVRAAFGMRDQKSPLPEVWVIDPSKEVIERYKKLFAPLGKQHLHAVAQPFSTAGKVADGLLKAIDRLKNPVSAGGL